MSECIFCKIAKKEIKSQFVLENEELIAIKDIQPHAPVHLLVIPKQHIPTLNDVGPKDLPLIGQMFAASQRLARDFKIADSGYRAVFNCNREGGQTVFHLHLHLLGGRQLGGGMVG
ncbi:MAG: histidine triad nucleotide-binding protein [Deltaproteobacteria bacterium]|nr:histidine triad nucleotide-binding protein [Deltaproteobacteria bacterium]